MPNLGGGAIEPTAARSHWIVALASAGLLLAALTPLSGVVVLVVSLVPALQPWVASLLPVFFNLFFVTILGLLLCLPLSIQLQKYQPGAQRKKGLRLPHWTRITWLLFALSGILQLASAYLAFQWEYFIPVPEQFLSHDFDAYRQLANLYWARVSILQITGFSFLSFGLAFEWCWQAFHHPPSAEVRSSQLGNPNP